MPEAKQVKMVCDVSPLCQFIPIHACKNSLCKSNNLTEIQKLSTEISGTVFKRKEYHNHLSMKLINPRTSAKTYWSILKSFYNGSKVPLIPPLLMDNNFVSDFTKRVNLFSPCIPITNSSVSTFK